MSNEIIRYDPDKRLSDMVESNGTLYLAGQVGEDLKPMLRARRKSILRQIDKLLARGGSDKSKILSTVIFVADMATKPGWTKRGRMDGPRQCTRARNRGSAPWFEPIRSSKSCASQ